MKQHLLLWALCLTATAPALAKSTLTDLTASCEEALALSALPLHLRSTANVYVLTDGKFIRTIDSEGGYHCLVERNHDEAIIPQCVTPNGSEEILPTLMMRTEMISQGKSNDEVTGVLKQKLAIGELERPTGFVVNYMMSNHNRIYNNDKLRQIPPHVMFYAPDVSNEDIGGSMALAMNNKGYPFVTQPGIHRYVVTMVESGSDSSQVESACFGQL